MSEQIDDGGTAFPCTEAGAGGGVFKEHFGMSLRDFFAAKALGGILADPNVNYDGDKDAELFELAKAVAKQSYAFSDALLAERKKGQP